MNIPLEWSSLRSSNGWITSQSKFQFQGCFETSHRSHLLLLIVSLVFHNEESLNYTNSQVIVLPGMIQIRIIFNPLGPYSPLSFLRFSDLMGILQLVQSDSSCNSPKSGGKHYTRCFSHSCLKLTNDPLPQISLFTWASREIKRGMEMQTKSYVSKGDGDFQNGPFPSNLVGWLVAWLVAWLFGCLLACWQWT